MVEGARIDMAHHHNFAKRAMEETLALEQAVETALEMTNRTETLVIVTADHSHSVTINGYPVRGNPITGLVYGPMAGFIKTPNNLSQPYTAISYANGPGYYDHFDNKTGFWRNLTGVNTSADNFRPMAMAPVMDDYETHGGEDVSVYAIGRVG